MKKSTLTEDKAEKTPTGGVLVGKREGQTIIHNKGTLSGYLVGKTHAEGGIKAVNKSTGQALEMQGGEVVITAPAVSDNTKNEFNGKMMTNREILSQINVKGGGVSFAKGGDIPKNIKRTGASYKYGGKTMTDHEIYKKITGGHLAEGMTLSKIAKMHKVSVKELQKQVDMGMKAESEHTSSKREQMKIVKDHLYENPEYYSLLKSVGLKHGGKVYRGSLVRDSKNGNTPARDLNNYNDVLDLDADGVVGAETGLYVRGGSLSYAKGGATDVTVNNWSEIPEEYKKIRLPKQIDWSPNPSNDGLYEIVKPFLEVGVLRPVMQGINFDDNGITVTNAHILLTIPNSQDDFRGIYKKIKGEEGFTKIDGTYPKYESVIPKVTSIDKVFNIDILKLLTYCKVAKNYSGKNEITFKVNDSQMSFNPDYIINFLTSLIKLTGINFWNVSYQTSKQALVFTKFKSYVVGRTIIGLIMPYIYGKSTKYGTENKDKNAVLNVYYDFDDNEIRNADGTIVDLDVKPTKTRAKRTSKTTTSKTSEPSGKILTKEEIFESKIWIGNDIFLRDKVIEKLFELGISNDSSHGDLTSSENIYIVIYSRDFVVWSTNKGIFDGDKRKEIFADNLFPSASTTIKITDKFTTGELDVFKQIETIKKENNFGDVTTTEYRFGDQTSYFLVTNDETGDAYSLRSFRTSLGVLFEDKDKAKSKSIINKYLDWKSSTFSSESDETITDEDVEIKKQILAFINDGSWSLEKEIKLIDTGADKRYQYYKEFYKLQPPTIYTLTAISGRGLYPSDLKTSKFLEKIGMYDDFEESAKEIVKFSAGEIDMFNQIDKILDDNKIDKDNIKEYAFAKSQTTKDFTIENKQTGEKFIFRKFGLALGFSTEIAEREKIIALIRDYKEYKKSTPTQATEKIEVFKLIGLSSDGTESVVGIYGATELLENLKRLENTFPFREVFPFRIYDNNGKEHGSITFGRGNKTLPELEISIIESPIFDYYDWKEFINYDKEILKTQSDKFSDDEIDMFNQIDAIVEKYNITNVDVTDWMWDKLYSRDFDIVNTINGEVFTLRGYKESLGVVTDDAEIEKSKALIKDYLEWKKLTLTATAEAVEQPKPSQTEKPKRNFELERKYLSQRISDLAKELELKKPILSNEEVAFYQREINSFILKLRKLNDAEMSLKSIEERVRGVYDLKISALEKEYPETDMVSINGLKSQLTEKEYFNVRTPEFKSFFGDWETAYLNDSYAGVSKVINPITKEPQPVFHGTNVLFVNWQTYETNNAHYFAVKREFSEFFATTWEERTDKAGVDSEILKKLNPNRGSFLLRCFIDVKNPIDFSRFGVEKYPIREYLTFLRVNYNIGDFDFWTNITSHSGITQNTEVFAWQIIRLWQSFTKYVKVFTTYDGYIFYEYIPTTPYGGLENASLSYCAFESNQIKFTDAYEFNALSNDSRFDLGGIL